MGKAVKRKALPADERCFEFSRFVCSGVEPPEDLSTKNGFVYPLDHVDVCATGCKKCVCLIPEEEEQDRDDWFFTTCSRLGVDVAPLIMSLVRGVVPDEVVVAPHCSRATLKHCIAFLQVPRAKIVYPLNITFLNIGDKRVHELRCVHEVDRRAAFGNLISTIDGAKDTMSEGLYVRLCKAAKAAYDRSAPA